MSYARFSEGDIYLYYHMRGYYICQMCLLAPKIKSIFTVGCDNAIFKCEPCKYCNGEGCNKCMIYGDTTMHTVKESIDHEKEHIKAGHCLPDDTLPLLESESEQ